MYTPITINKKRVLSLPASFIEAGFNMSAKQFDIFSLIVSEFSECSNLVVETLTLSFEDLDTISNYSSVKAARVAYKRYFDTKNKKKCTISVQEPNGDWVTHYIFEDIQITKKGFVFVLNTKVYDLLYKWFTSKEPITYAPLSEIFALKSVYSKHLLLMCKRFNTSHNRFVDKNWKDFCIKLGVPTSYSYANICSMVLDKSFSEIKMITKYDITYTVHLDTYFNYNKPISIEFNIINLKKTDKPKTKKKKKSKTKKNKDFVEVFG